MIVLIIVLVAIGATGTMVLLCQKSGEDREYEDECQIEYLASLEQKSRRKKRWTWRKAASGQAGGH